MGPWWLNYFVLPIVLPMLVGASKTLMMRAAPAVTEKVPKVFWPSLAAAFAQLATTLSPDMFLMPGLPPQLSTALYAVAGIGVREFVDQLRKSTGVMPPGRQPGDTSPAPSVLDSIEGQIAIHAARRHPKDDIQAQRDITNTAASLGVEVSGARAAGLLAAAREYVTANAS